LARQQTGVLEPSYLTLYGRRIGTESARQLGKRLAFRDDEEQAREQVGL
jgi:hypothetical protein